MDIEHPEVWPREVLWTCWIIAFELLCGTRRAKWGYHVLCPLSESSGCYGAFPTQILYKEEEDRR